MDRNGSVSNSADSSDSVRGGDCPEFHTTDPVKYHLNQARLLLRSPSNWLLGLFLFASHDPGPCSAGEVITHPYCGITMITRIENVPRNLIMHIAQVNLEAPGIEFKLTAPNGPRDTIRQTTLDFLNQEHAQLAINAHFYLPFGTPELEANLAGFAASAGVVYSAFENQPLGDGYTDQSYAIVPFAPALNIDRFNHPSIIHRDPSYPDNRHVLEPVTLWTALAGSGQIITDGIKTIPSYTGVPGGLNPLNSYSDTNSWYQLLRARTVIGITRDKTTLVLFTVDESAGNAGMTVEEVADLLIEEYQIYDALNLDGDGSTTMAMEDPVTHSGRIVNSSSDNELGRAVGSNLAVLARKNIEPAVRLSINATATNTIILSWRGSDNHWKAQRSSKVDPAFWQDVDALPEPAGDRMQFVLPIESSAGFLRVMQNIPRMN